MLQGQHEMAGAMAAGFTGSLPAGFVPSPATGPVAQPSTEDGGGDADHATGAAIVSHAKDTPPKEDSGLLTLPLTRVKRMVKEEEDVKAVSGDAVFAVARATELFLEELASRTAANVPPTSKRGVTYREVSQAVSAYKPCDFLADIVPQKVTAAQLLQQMQVAATAQQQKQANGADK